MGCTPGFEFNIGFELDCPSAAYEFVIESITDCAFSWPISTWLLDLGEDDSGLRTYAGSSRRHCANDYDRYYGLCARSWSRA